MGDAFETRRQIEEELRTGFVGASLLRGQMGEMMFTVAENTEDLETVIVTPYEMVDPTGGYPFPVAGLDSTVVKLTFVRDNYFEEDLHDPQFRQTVLGRISEQS